MCFQFPAHKNSIHINMHIYVYSSVVHNRPDWKQPRDVYQQMNGQIKYGVMLLNHEKK